MQRGMNRATSAATELQRINRTHLDHRNRQATVGARGIVSTHEFGTNARLAHGRSACSLLSRQHGGTSSALAAARSTSSSVEMDALPTRTLLASEIARSAAPPRTIAACNPTAIIAIPAAIGAARPSRENATRAPLDAITTAGTVPAQNAAITSMPSIGDALAAAIAANA